MKGTEGSHVILELKPDQHDRIVPWVNDYQSKKSAHHQQQVHLVHSYHQIPCRSCIDNVTLSPALSL